MTSHETQEYFVVTPHNFIIAKLSIRKPGSSSVLIISDLLEQFVNCLPSYMLLSLHVVVAKGGGRERFYITITVKH